MGRAGRGIFSLKTVRKRDQRHSLGVLEAWERKNALRRLLLAELDLGIGNGLLQRRQAALSNGPAATLLVI
jgi:hypothetical protein